MENQHSIERDDRDEILYHITEGIAGATGEEFFRSLTRHLANALQLRYSFVTECTDESRNRVRALAFWDGTGFTEDIEYPLVGTPCEKVIEGNVCAYPERLQLLFPADKGLVTLGAESFAGVPLPNHQGKVLGHLVVMDTKHRVFGETELRILRIFATRASAELERSRADHEVKLLNAELSMLIDINRAVGRHLHRDSLFGALAECLKTLVPTERFGIELPIDGDQLQGHILSTIQAAGAPTQSTLLPAAGTACDWVLRHHIWFIAGCRDEFRERFPVTHELMAGEGMESLCALPLVSGERALGALFFMAAERDAYGHLRRQFLEQVANQVAIAVANMKSYEEIEALNASIAAAAARRRTILDINNAIVTKLTRDELLAAVSEALARVIRFDRLALSLYEPKENCLSILSYAGPYQRDDRRDRERERLTSSEERAYGHGFRSICAVPLVVRGLSIGGITIGSLTPEQYSEADADFLMEVAGQIAIAVDNMKAHGEVESLKARFEAEAVYLQEEIKTEHNFEEIIGQSAPIRQLLKKLEQVAPTDATVLIHGETGTGKELLARAVQDRSRRKDRPLVKVNCGSIPSGLVESELFGHERGAFTGATQQRIGRFELANGGTIFLDEVTELPLDTQVKLLRVLQEGEFERVGSSRTIKVEVRVIAATNRNLQEVVRSGTFRADLFYRLNVFPLEVPPLRERPEDIPLLVNFFLSRFGKNLGKEVRGVSQKSMESLTKYAWPGNIRELQNVIERAVVLAKGPIVQIQEGRGGDSWH